MFVEKSWPALLKKNKVESVEPIEKEGKLMYHLGKQLMMYVDTYNEKSYVRIAKYEHNKERTNIYPTKAGISISNPEGFDLMKKINENKNIQHIFKMIYETIKEQLIEKKNENCEGPSSSNKTSIFL